MSSLVDARAIEDFAGPGWQLPPGGGRTAADAYAGLEVGILPPPGPSPAVGTLLTAGALPEVAGGCRGAEPPAGRSAAGARGPLGNNAGSVSGSGPGLIDGSCAVAPRPRHPSNSRKTFARDRQRRELHRVSQRVAPPGSSWSKCGRVPHGLRGNHGKDASLSVVGVVGQYAAIAGLCTCGCPRCVLCGPKIARERAEDLRALMSRIYAAGGRCICAPAPSPMMGAMTSSSCVRPFQQPGDLSSKGSAGSI